MNKVYKIKNRGELLEFLNKPTTEILKIMNNNILDASSYLNSIKDILEQDKKKIKEYNRYKRKYRLVSGYYNRIISKLKASTKTTHSKFKIWNKLYNEGFNDALQYSINLIEKYRKL